MNRRPAFARLAALAALALMLAPMPILAGTAFQFDAARSQAEFGVRLLWLHTISGRFAQITGAVRLDAKGLATVDAHIRTSSLTMASASLRRSVLAEDFFDAAHYPGIHFLSEPVPLARLSNGGALEGWLSLRGVTRRVRFELLPARCSGLTARGCTIEARGAILRSAFGMSSHRATLSDRVQLGLQIALDPARD